MALHPSQRLEKKQLEAGTVLFEADKPIELLTMLHDGQVYAINQKQGPNTGLYMYTIPQNRILGFGSLLRHTPPLVTYVTATSALISAFPVKGDFDQITMGKLNLEFMAAHSLLNEATDTYQMVSKLAILAEQLYKLTDNVTLAYKCCLPGLFQDKQTKNDKPKDPILQMIQATISAFEENGGKYPDKLTKEWLQTDHSSKLRTSYRFQTRFYTEGFRFFQKMLNLPTNIQSLVYKADSGLLKSLSQQLTHILNQNTLELYILQERINARLKLLFTDYYGYCEKLHTLATNYKFNITKVSFPEIQELLQFFYHNSKAILQEYQALHKIPYQNATEHLKKLASIMPGEAQEKPTPSPKGKEGIAPTPTLVGLDGSAIRKQLQGSASHIMSSLQIEAEEKEAVLKNLAELKKLSSSLHVSQELSRLYNALSRSYWNIWEIAYHHYQKQNGKVEPHIQMLLNFGFLDEDLLDNEHLAYLWECIQQPPAQSSYPIFTTIEWADKIYSKEELPSVDGFARSYIRELNKKVSVKSDAKEKAELFHSMDTIHNRLKHEIENFFRTTSRITSGTPNACLPILNRYQLTAPIEEAILTKKKLCEEIDNILSIDYSAFHREVLLNDPDKGVLKEFIQEKVLPYFILVPSAGTKATVWQEISTHSKSSPGRIACPAFVTANLSNLLIEVVAAFRWEIVKTVMGASWNDISQPSITSEYTDYVQFYKKNRELSLEVKEKLHAEFKKFRSDRDRFANDYHRWVKYESQGIPRLNKIVRSIFYRHIPFNRVAREQIANRPIFAELNTRFKNIRNKKLKSIEAHYRKYGDQLPAKLKANLEFYKDL